MGVPVGQNTRLARARSIPLLAFGQADRQHDHTEAVDCVVRKVGSGLARVVGPEPSPDGKPMPNPTRLWRTLEEAAGTD